MSATSPRIVAALTGPRPVRLAALLSDPEETYRSLWETPAVTRTAALDETTPVVVERVDPSTRVAPDGSTSRPSRRRGPGAGTRRRPAAAEDRRGRRRPTAGPRGGTVRRVPDRAPIRCVTAVRRGAQPRAPTATAFACRLASSWTVWSYRPCRRAARTCVRRVARLAVLSARAALRKK